MVIPIRLVNFLLKLVSRLHVFLEQKALPRKLPVMPKRILILFTFYRKILIAKNTYQGPP